MGRRAPSGRPPGSVAAQLAWCTGSGSYYHAAAADAVRGRDRRPGSGSPVRDVRDDGVLATEEGGLEAACRLVVEEPIPPVARDVLGQHDDRDRLRPVG